MLDSSVLVLLDTDHVTASEVISFTFTTTALLGLEALEVGIVLDELDNTHDA